MQKKTLHIKIFHKFGSQICCSDQQSDNNLYLRRHLLILTAAIPWWLFICFALLALYQVSKIVNLKAESWVTPFYCVILLSTSEFSVMFKVSVLYDLRLGGLKPGESALTPPPGFGSQPRVWKSPRLYRKCANSILLFAQYVIFLLSGVIILRQVFCH